MRPLFFLIAYVAVVVGFAKLYQVLCPGDFYAPYAHLEGSWKLEEARGGAALQSALERAIADYASQRDPISRADLNLLKSSDPAKRQSVHLMKITLVRVTDFHTDGSRFHFVVYFEAPTRDDPNPTGIVEPFIPRFRAIQAYSGRLVTTEQLLAPPSYPSLYSTLVPKAVAPLELTESIDDNPTAANPFFRSLVPYPSNVHERRLYLDDNEAQALREVLDEYSGVSVRIGADFGRMLYMSIVVSSTLGLGDIVPLSGVARTLVGLEVLLGIIIASAFVNSVHS